MPSVLWIRNKKPQRKKQGLLFKVYGFKLTVGFTLVELLVVMGILGVIVGSTLLFLTSILRGSNQASVVSEIKQNGQVVLDTIDRQIRNSQGGRLLSLDDLGGSVSAIELAQSDGSYLYLACFASVEGVSNGWIGIATRSTASPPADASGYLSLTNRDVVSGVDIVCNPSPFLTFAIKGVSSDSFPQVVQVAFRGKKGVLASARADFDASADFATTISLRKY